MDTIDAKLYSVRVEWSEEDECYIASFPAWEAVSGHGETPEEALREGYTALELALESMEELGKAPPAPDRALEEIRRFAPVLNVSALARLAGINKHTLRTKLRRGSRFDKEEADKISKALSR